jgi:hypothetical protein
MRRARPVIVDRRANAPGSDIPRVLTVREAARLGISRGANALRIVGLPIRPGPDGPTRLVLPRPT